jgi:hypothetical protein
VTVAEPRAYAARLTSDLAAACDGALAAAYLHGSAALGGWVAGHSDVDVLFIVAAQVPEVDMARAGELLLASGASCPGSGLECSIVTAEAARNPAPPWPFVLHAATAEGKLARGDRVAGDPDLLIHYAVCRAAGVRLLGPPPSDCIGPVERPVILAYLAEELGWGLAHAAECYAVLNACRALVFLSDGQIVSKVAGGTVAMERGLAPRGLVRQALDQQQGTSARQQPGPAATEFVLGVAEALKAASQPRGGAVPTS